MNKNFKRSVQGGFTLIELIVVIVILGILAATALPKFANLGGDARFAALNATKGAMASAAAIVRGQILVNPAMVSNNKITIENTAIDLSNGYPAASATGIVAAANIAGSDFTIIPAGAATATTPLVPANAIGLVPASIAGTATAVNCFVTYTPAMAATTGTTPTPATAPVLAITGSATACQ